MKFVRPAACAPWKTMRLSTVTGAWRYSMCVGPLLHWTAALTGGGPERDLDVIQRVLEGTKSCAASDMRAARESPEAPWSKALANLETFAPYALTPRGTTAPWCVALVTAGSAQDLGDCQ